MTLTSGISWQHGNETNYRPQRIKLPKPLAPLRLMEEEVLRRGVELEEVLRRGAELPDPSSEPHE